MLSLFCSALLCVHSSFAFILKRKRKLVAFLDCLQMYNYYSVTLPWVGLQCAFVVFPCLYSLAF